jgi:hypothetical protein
VKKMSKKKAREEVEALSDGIEYMDKDEKMAAMNTSPNLRARALRCSTVSGKIQD